MAKEQVNLIKESVRLSPRFKGAGRRRQKDKNIRKLTRMGKFSLGVSIPVDILIDLNWREKQRVVVKKVRGGVLIRDWKR